MAPVERDRLVSNLADHVTPGWSVFMDITVDTVR